LLRAFDAGEFPQTLYIDGPSEALKTALLSELRRTWARHCPEAPLARVFRAAESGVEDIVSAYRSVSLFSPRELILAIGVEALSRSDKRVAALAQGIADPAGETCLILVEAAADTPRKKLEPLRQACGARYEAWPPGRGELLAWGKRRLRTSKLDVEDGVAELLVDASEGDPLAFFSELDKLCAWARTDEPVTKDDAAALLRPVVGADLPEFLSAVAAGQPVLASQRLGRVLAAGVAEGQVLFALSNLVGGALGGWARHRELSGLLRRRLGPPALSRAVDAMYRAESAWKGGRAQAAAVLEQATRDLSGTLGG